MTLARKQGHVFSAQTSDTQCPAVEQRLKEEEERSDYYHAQYINIQERQYFEQRAEQRRTESQMSFSKHQSYRNSVTSGSAPRPSSRNTYHPSSRSGHHASPDNED